MNFEKAKYKLSHIHPCWQRTNGTSVGFSLWALSYGTDFKRNITWE